MRAALQGVPVENLPGESGGGLISGLFGGGNRSASADPVPPASLPPASVPTAAGASRQTTGSSGGLDGWFINNLFGRR